MADKVVPEIPTQEMLRAAAGCYTLRNDPAPAEAPRVVELENLLRRHLEAMPGLDNDLAEDTRMALNRPFRILCDGCDKTMAEHDAMAHCPTAAPAEAPRPVLTDAQRAAGWRETTDPDEFLRDIGAAPAEAPPAVDPYTKGFADGVRMLTETRLAASRERERALREALQQMRREAYENDVIAFDRVNELVVSALRAAPDSAAEQGEAG